MKQGVYTHRNICLNMAIDPPNSGALSCFQNQTAECFANSSWMQKASGQKRMVDNESQVDPFGTARLRTQVAQNRKTVVARNYVQNHSSSLFSSRRRFDFTIIQTKLSKNSVAQPGMAK